MKFQLPELGEGVHEGELVKWRVKPGEIVKDDQPLLEVMTDKATVEIPSPFSGKIEALHAKEGETIKVGQTLITMEGYAAANKSAEAKAPAAKAPEAPKAAAAPAPAPQAAAPARAPAPMSASSQNLGNEGLLAAPATRRLARELGVDLSRVKGTGPEGRVVKEDLDRFIRSGAAGMMAAGGTVSSAGLGMPRGETRARPSGGEERVAFKGLRKKIAEKMRLSKDHAAHFTYVEEADASELVKLREKAKEIGAAQGVKVTYLPFIMKAMVAALRQYPILNSSLDEEKGELVYKHFFNIGLSIQTEDGLTAPVVKDVEHKNIWELARDIQNLVERARKKQLTLDDFQGGTITLTNAGSIGGLFATPVINYPEVAILGFNKIFRKPVVKTLGGSEKIVIRDWTYFSISLDHRVVDGAIGAEFMKLFIQYIETPSLLLLESF